MAPTEVLTEPEQRAIAHLVDFVNVMSTEVIGQGPSRGGDIAELIDKVHQLQAVIMAQACARAMPDQFRLLGDAVA